MLSIQNLLLIKLAKPTLFLILYITMPNPAFAQDVSTVSLPAENLNLIQKNSGWSLGLLYGSVAYSEPSLMTETGSMSGASLSYSHAFRNNPLLVRLEGEYLYGQLIYNGSTWAGAPMIAPAADNLLNGRALLGFQIQPTERLNITPFLGIAARYLNDQIQDSYDREITSFYLPIGLNFTLGVTDRWAFTFAGEYDYFIDGNAVSHLNQSNSAYPIVDNTQNSGFGYRLTTGVQRAFAGWNLKISPYIDYWSVQKSNTQTFVANNQTLSVWEPSNTSMMYGVSVSVTF
jgi:hypothetical protein